MPAPDPLALRLREREGVVVELEEKLTVPQVEGVEVVVVCQTAWERDGGRGSDGGSERWTGLLQWWSACQRRRRR